MSSAWPDRAAKHATLEYVNGLLCPPEPKHAPYQEGPGHRLIVVQGFAVTLHAVRSRRGIKWQFGLMKWQRHEGVLKVDDEHPHFAARRRSQSDVSRVVEKPGQNLPLGNNRGTVNGGSPKVLNEAMFQGPVGLDSDDVA